MADNKQDDSQLQDDEVVENRLDDEGVEEPSDDAPAGVEKVELDAKTLRDLLTRIDSLEAERKGNQQSAGLYKKGKWVDTPEEKRQHTATLRKYRADTDSHYMYVTDFKFLMWSLNELTKEREQIYKISFYDPRDKKTLLNPIVKTFSLKRFAEEFERENVTILEQRKTPKTMLTGQTMKREHDYSKFKSKDVGMVPTYVKAIDIECMIQLEDGTKMWINSDRLNA